jgi:hypothetical protein
MLPFGVADLVVSHKHPTMWSHKAFYNCGEGGRRANVANIFAAKIVTAVISVTAETGSHDQKLRDLIYENFRADS